MIEASMEEAKTWAARGPEYRDAGRSSADAALVDLVRYLAEQLDDPNEIAQVRRILEIFNSF